MCASAITTMMPKSLRVIFVQGQLQTRSKMTKRSVPERMGAPKVAWPFPYHKPYPQRIVHDGGGDGLVRLRNIPPNS